MNFEIINADVYSGLSYLSNDYIDCAVTSPPYWAQRDYGFDGQIGNESTYMGYISKLVIIYNLLRKKLNKKGIFFLNIGDKYLSKYGKSPLGLIPYKLAYFMEKDGWILNDILIWYKPNHMPSSIKNRFSNTYEPVFVFSKEKENYYTEYKKLNKNVAKILKIKVQLTSYKHVATYPEKLVENLLLMLNLPEKALVLDPFAGSGTTGKSVINLNESLVYQKSLSCVMIERSDEFVNIIKSRCNLAKSKVVKLPFIKYDIPQIIEENTISNSSKLLNLVKLKDKRGLVKITENKGDYYNQLDLFFHGYYRGNLRLDSTIFIGSKEFNLELLYKTSLLNNYNWIVRNMIIVSDKNSYYPVFMVVDDNKKYNYLFNIEKVRIKHKHDNSINWKDINFIDYKVYDKFHKEKKEGHIIKIVDYYNNNFPKWVIVQWNNNTQTKEYIIYDDEDMDDKIQLLCSKCNSEINIKYYDPFNTNKCEKCNCLLWKEIILKFIEDNTIIEGFNNKHIDFDNISNLKKETNIKKLIGNEKYCKNYNGKFKDALKINLGASPGARASTQEEYFTVKRLYNINQPIVCDYLNYKRKQKQLSKKTITELFPKEYKHTVGHWLRKDFGGSLPLPSDWKKLIEILDIDENITNCLCRTGLKLQMVKSYNKGKNPGDYLEGFNGTINKFLEKVFI